jgi:hypothetical protein
VRIAESPESVHRHHAQTSKPAIENAGEPCGARFVNTASVIATLPVTFVNLRPAPPGAWIVRCSNDTSPTQAAEL